MKTLFCITCIIVLYLFDAHASDDKTFSNITTLNQQMGQCLKSYRPGMDVHAFNRTLKPLAPLLTKINKELNLDKLQAHELMIGDLYKLRSDLKFGVEYDIEITALKNFFMNGLDFDSETSTYVKSTLSAILNHLKIVDEKQKLSVASQLFFYLKQNTTEGGKCFPGYAGRLMIVNISCLEDHYIFLKSLKER